MGDNDKVVLLGAGASAEAGIPITRDLTPMVLETARQAEVDERRNRDSREWDAYHEQLQAAFGDRWPDMPNEVLRRTGRRPVQQAVNPVEEIDFLRLIYADLVRWQLRDGLPIEEAARVDLEVIVTILDALAGRSGVGVGLFVRAWDDWVLDADRGRVRMLRLEAPVEAYDSALQRYVESIAVDLSRPGDGTAFRDARARVEKAALSHLRVSNSVDYLAPLVGAAADGTATIVSLNYDVSIELAGKASGFTTSLGTRTWDRTLALDFSDGDLPLLKLHGSVSLDERSWDGLFVLGGDNKLRADGPFLALLLEFQRRLAASGELIVIGYSFRDAHVNAAMASVAAMRFLAGDPLPVTIVDPKPAAHWQQVSRMIADTVRRAGGTVKNDSVLVDRRQVEVGAGEALASGLL